MLKSSLDGCDDAYRLVKGTAVVPNIDQYLGRFLILAEISDMLKKSQLEKLVSPMKFTRRYFSDVNEVSIVFS